MVASTAELTPGALIDGLDPAGPVAVVQSQAIGGSSVQLTFRRMDGTLDDQIIFGDRLSGLRIVAAGRARGFDADGRLFKLAAEAARIRLAHLFDPYIAVNDLSHRAAAAPDHRRLRGDADPPAAAFSARR